MGHHDLSYRDFFSHPRMIRDLLLEIVGEQWVERIDFESGELTNTSFVKGVTNRREVKASVHRLQRSVPRTEGALREVFEGWLQNVILPRLKLSEAEQASVPRTLEEVETMLAESIDRWTREIQDEAHQKGLQEGRLEERALLVLRLLRLKFGPLSAEAEARVRSADADLLLQWGERVVTAGSLAEVFGD